MSKLLNADLFMENPENYIRGEKISNIVPNNPYYVEHSIYFAETLSVFEDVSKTKRLVLGLDYEFNILDSIASEQSNKDCYRAVLFLKSFPAVYIDYHSYGDLVTAESLNKILNNVGDVLQTSQEVSTKVDALSKSVVEHINKTTAHAATESVVNNSIALRTDSGTLKASDAQSDNDLTTFAQTKNQISDAKSEMSAKLKEAKDELTHQFNIKIEELIDNAPDALNTLKELADALTENKDGLTTINAALANRYTKQEVDDKDTSTLTSSKNYTNEKIDSLEISQKGVMPLNPVCYYDFADMQYTTIITHGRIESTGIHELKRFNISEYKGKSLRITLSGYKQGEGSGLILFVWNENWEWSKAIELSKYEDYTKILNVLLPSEYNQIFISIYHHPQNQLNNTVVMTGLKVEVLDNILIDSSGNEIHSQIVGDVSQTKDNKVGTVLKFNKGYLLHPYQNFIGVEKKWSHSRWVKLNEEQEKLQSHRPWCYMGYDYAWFGLKPSNWEVDQFLWISTYKNSDTKFGVKIPKEKVFDNNWHNLIVMTDLRYTYCRKIVYLDGFKLIDETKNGDFRDWIETGDHCDGAKGNFSPSESTIISTANLLFFNKLLTDQEAKWLSLNPQYPVKNYTLADWKLDKVNPDSEVNLRILGDKERYTKENANKKFVTKAAFNLKGSTLEITI